MTTFAPIQMTADASEGSFVKTLVGETGTGYEKGTHVHKDWWNKSLTHDQVCEQIESARGEREDIEATLGSMTPIVNEMDQFAFKFQDGRVFVPTEHALCQMGTHIGVSTHYLMSLQKPVPQTNRIADVNLESDEYDAAAMVYAVNNRLRKMDLSKERKFRTYSDGTLRSWVSDQYAYVDNRWYVDFLNEILPDSRYSHWRGDSDTLYGNVLIQDSLVDYPDDSDYGTMVGIGNCEIGKRRLSYTPSLFRSICMNGCQHGVCSGSKSSQVHRGEINYEQLRSDIHNSITTQLNLYPKQLETLLDSRKDVIKGVNVNQLLVEIARQGKMKPGETVQLFEAWNKEPDQKNRFGVINAVTRAGQGFNNKRWVEMDILGGEIMSWNTPTWESTLKRASTITDEQMQKSLGV